MAFLLLPDHFEKMADNRGRGDNALIVCDGDPYITDARYTHCSHKHARPVLSAYELVIQTPTKGTSKRAQGGGLGQTARAGAQNSKSGAPKKSCLSLNHVGAHSRTPGYRPRPAPETAAVDWLAARPKGGVSPAPMGRSAYLPWRSSSSPWRSSQSKSLSTAPAVSLSSSCKQSPLSCAIWDHADVANWLADPARALCP
jgi:hypothetical protein